MKFGKVNQVGNIDFTLPEDHARTRALLNTVGAKQPLQVYVGCAKWNRKELRDFYPKGTRDELGYYASHFNAIELNATFYRIFPLAQYRKWCLNTPEYFRFFPKVVQQVSHLRRLNEMAYPYLDDYLKAISHFGEKLGTVFLQLPPNFGVKHWDRVHRLAQYWPADVPLALELRHPDWFNEKTISEKLCSLLERRHITNILVDTAGRRDLLHMRLTTAEAFVRFVGANHPVDYERLDDWVIRLKHWHGMGLRKVSFFIHENNETSSPVLAAYVIRKINENLSVKLRIPRGRHSDGEPAGQ